ncbi:MAG: sigma-70 family RNA polymerase sigma factor [Eubacterium sp.]|nr:sigma-70 family RNA polymerase sigma factor [Eubacterium sp.]
MNCTHCGAPLESGDRFCMHCGNPVQAKQPSQNATIAALVDRARQQDNEAFSQLFAMTQKKAYFTALKFVQNEEDAQDVLQEAYIKAFTSLSSLRDSSRFVTWLNIIVGNCAKRSVMRQRPDVFAQYRDDETGYDPEDSLADEDEGILPPEVAESREIKQLVMGCIDRLPEEQKMCVVMFYFDELTTREIAMALELPENTVKSRLFIARRKLKNDFELLERQGTRLHGAAMAPLILSSFDILQPLSQQAAGKIAANAAAAIAKSAAAAGSAAGAGVAAATGAAAGAASGAIGASTGIFAGITAKVIAVALGVTVAAGGIAATTVAVKKHQQETADTSVSAQVEEEAADTAAEDATEAPIEPVSLDAAHQANVTRAMASSTAAMIETTEAGAYTAYQDYLYYIDYENTSRENDYYAEMAETVGKVYRKNLTTGESELFLNYEASDLLLYGSKLIVHNKEDGYFYLVDPKNASSSERLNLPKTELFLSIAGVNNTLFYPTMLLRGDELVYGEKEHDDEYGDQAKYKVYNLKTGATREMADDEELAQVMYHELRSSESGSVIYEDEEYIVLEEHPDTENWYRTNYEVINKSNGNSTTFTSNYREEAELVWYEEPTDIFIVDNTMYYAKNVYQAYLGTDGIFLSEMHPAELSLS